MYNMNYINKHEHTHKNINYTIIHIKYTMKYPFGRCICI